MKEINKYSEDKLNFDNKNIDKSIESLSISGVLSLISEEFNQREVAEKTFNKRYNDESSEYYHMTVDEIIKKWENKAKTSLKYGRLNDEYIGIILEGNENDKELYELDNDIDSDERLSTQVLAFNNFIDDLPDYIEYVCREKTVYYKINDKYIKGRFDALFYNKKTNKWIIVDWKTSGTIDTTPTKWTTKLLGAAKEFDALNYNTYTMQLYFYKIALIEGGYLPKNTSYDDIEVMIVNIPNKESDRLYKKYPSAFKFNKEIMDKIFEYTLKKNTILKKKNGK